MLEARPAAAIYHPYIHEAGERGPFVDVNARAQFIGLSMRTSFLDLVRAVYEGLAFAARDCYGAMGHVPEEIRLAGGASRSKSFKTILASALATPVRDSRRQEAGAAGAAMMAAVAIGVFPDLGAATKIWVTPLLGDLFPPDPALVAIYDQAFPDLCRRPEGDAAGLGRTRRHSQRSYCMTEIAIIGDRFMLPDAFAAALRPVVGDDVRLRTLELPWPDEPMTHGYAGPGLAGLKEYQGDPDAMADFIGEAQILVDHLAPVTGGMLDRLPGLKLIAVSAAAARSISTWTRPASAACWS